MNRRSPLLLQSGEVVQAVAVSHLYIWIDCDLLTLVGILKSMFIKYFEDDLLVSHLLPGHDGVLGDHVGDPAPVDPQRVRAARVVEQDLGEGGVSPRLCWDVLCLISL